MFIMIAAQKAYIERTPKNRYYRVIMEVARQGLLPYGHIFGKVNPKIGSPVNAYLLQYALSIIFIVGPPPGAVYQFIVAFAAYPVYVSTTFGFSNYLSCAYVSCF